MCQQSELKQKSLTIHASCSEIAPFFPKLKKGEHRVVAAAARKLMKQPFFTFAIYLSNDCERCSIDINNLSVVTSMLLHKRKCETQPKIQID